MKVSRQVLGSLTDFQAWASNSSTPISILDYVGFVATPDLLFAFAELFSPELMTHGGRRFLASGFAIETYEAWKSKGLSGPEIQRVMNHVHVSTLLQDQDVGDEVAVAVAVTVASFWRRTLGGELSVESAGSCLHDAYVTFFDLEDRGSRS